LLARSIETFRRLTDEDALTALPNHRAMLKRLEDAMTSRRSRTVVLALIDLDAFREVNEALGRAGGDAVLVQIAEHLKAGVPAEALFGRFEDDEFAVLMTCDDARGADTLAASLRAVLSGPILVDRASRLSATVGLAQAPDDGTTAEELARRAGLALRAAKREGRGLMRRASSRRSSANTPSGGSSCASSNAPSPAEPLRFTISRSSPPTAAASSAPKRCCAGPIPCAARLRRRCSFLWPSRTG
jgi:diguanylate cyclase (GGDEF)-like protein